MKGARWIDELSDSELARLAEVIRVELERRREALAKAAQAEAVTLPVLGEVGP